ncbi:MAG: nitrous oxide reductase family maturation protein NosD, partial [bacterium]
VDPGDTVKVDVGTYGETVSIPVNDLALVGADSAATVFDVPASAHKGLTAISQSGLSLSHFQVRNSSDTGIYLDQVDSSEFVSLAVKDNFVGLLAKNSSGDTVTGITAEQNTGVGVALVNSTSARIAYNDFDKNQKALYLKESNSNTILDNKFTSDTYGIGINTSNNNLVKENTILSSKKSAVLFQNFSPGNTNNRLVHNTIELSSVGIHIHNVGSADSPNRVLMNDISSNDTAIYVESSPDSTGLLIADNNIHTEGQLFFSEAALPGSFDFRNNFWNTTDEAVLESSVRGTDSDSVLVSPYRLGLADTGVGADTVAPDTTDFISVSAGDETVALEWNEVTSNEDGSALNDFFEYRIYRDTAPIDSAAGPSGLSPLDSTRAGTTSFVDTAVASG